MRSPGLSAAASRRLRHPNARATSGTQAIAPDRYQVESALGIHSSIYAGRSWGMRHRLPHARGTRRGMLILVLPLRTFGNGGAGELIDGGILARALMNPITAGGKKPPPPSQTRAEISHLTAGPPPPP